MEKIKSQVKLNEEESKLYDRQLRVWGEEVQKKFPHHVHFWIQPMTACNMDLAKNLILAGISITIFDNEKITQEDYDDNSLVVESDIGKNRGEIIAQRLRQMNTLVKIENKPAFDITQTPEEDILKAVSEFNIITINTTSFKEMELWDNISKKSNIPLYILVCCGQYGFSYISLGKEYNFIREKKKKVNMGEDDVEIIDEEEEEKIPMEQVKIKSLQFKNAFIPIKKIRRTTKVFLAIKMMNEASKENLLQKSNKKIQESKEFQEKCLTYVEAIYKKENKILTEDDSSFYKEFTRQYGINYCPVFSILGSVCCQEIIKIIGQKEEPTLNWFCYDSQAGYGKVENFQNKEETYSFTDLNN